MDLNSLPKEADNLPEGVSEVLFETEPEMDAFMQGFTYCGEVPGVHAGEPFERDGIHVVRIHVGDFGDSLEFEEEEDGEAEDKQDLESLNDK